MVRLKINIDYFFLAGITYCLFYAPCLLGAKAIIALHNFLSLLAINKHFLSGISPRLCSAIYLLTLTKYAMCCFPLSLLPSIFPVSIRFSNHSFLIICLRNLYGHFLMLSISFIFISIFTKTSSLLTRSVHGILSILLEKHISIASILHFIDRPSLTSI